MIPLTHAKNQLPCQNRRDTDWSSRISENVFGYQVYFRPLAEFANDQHIKKVLQQLFDTVKRGFEAKGLKTMPGQDPTMN
jgi:hypothetical protein